MKNYSVNSESYQVTEIRVIGGIGRVWESRPSQWRWTHYNGSEGFESTFEKAVEELEAIAIRYFED